MIIKPTRTDIFISQTIQPVGYIIGVGISSFYVKEFPYTTLFGLLIGWLIVVLFVLTILFRETQEWATFIISENGIEGPSGAFISGKRAKFDFEQITEVNEKHPWLTNPKIICGNQKIIIPPFINRKDRQRILSYVKERISCADVSL